MPPRRSANQSAENSVLRLGPGTVHQAVDNSSGNAENGPCEAADDPESGILCCLDAERKDDRRADAKEYVCDPSQR